MEERINQELSFKDELIEQGNLINFNSLLEILLRRKKIFIILTIGFFLVASSNLFYRRIKKPIYRGSFTLMISDPFMFNKSSSNNLADVALNREGIDIPTLIQYLKSPDVISSIAENNNLSPINLINNIQISVPENEGRLGNYLSKTLQVSLDGEDKIQMQKVLGELSNHYIIKASESRNEKISEGIKFLNIEKPKLLAKVKKAQNKLENFMLLNKVIDPIQEGNNLTNLIEINKNNILAVESENLRLLFIKENLVNGILYTEGIISNGSGDGAGLGIIGSDQLLLQEILDVKSQLANAQSKYKKTSIVIKNLQEKLSQLEPILLKNQKSAVEAAIIVNDSLIKSYQNQIIELQKKFIEIPAKVTQYTSIVQDLKSLEANLQTINETQDKLELDLSQETLPWKIIREPIVDNSPIKPQIRSSLTYIIIYTFIFASLLTFLIERFDDVFHNSKEIEKFIKLPILGFIPFLNLKNDDDEINKFITVSDLIRSDKNDKNIKFIYEETFRNIYTSIKFSKSDKDIKIVNITSTVPEEGKSLCSLFLAINISQIEKKVLIIDADLRRPSLHKRLEVDNVVGISNYLVNNDQDWRKYITQHNKYTNLSYFTSGKIPPNSISLLESDKMKSFMKELKESNEYDFIVIDCPPVLGLSDSLIISNYVDAAILTVSLNKVKKKLAMECLNKLKIINKPIIGTIINSIQKESHKSFLGNNYYSYNNQYSFYSYKYMPLETQNKYFNKENKINSSKKKTFRDFFENKNFIDKARSILNSFKNWLDE